MKIHKKIQNLSKFYRLIMLQILLSVSFGGNASFSSTSYTVAENVANGYIDITINCATGAGTCYGLLGIEYGNNSTAVISGSNATNDDADYLYSSAAKGTNDGYNQTTDYSEDQIQVFFNGEASKTISIGIDDDSRWEGGPSVNHEYLEIELYTTSGAPVGITGNTEAKVYITDNETSEPVLTFFQETSTANEHVSNRIYIVVDGDVALGNVNGVSPTFTWEIVNGSSNGAIIDEAEYGGSYNDHYSATSGQITFDETDYGTLDGVGRQLTYLDYRAINDSRSEPEEQLEIRFQAASATHCQITGGTNAVHIHKITDYDWNQNCDYGDCYPEPYFANASATKNETGTSGNIDHTFTINLNGVSEIVPSTLNINVTTTTGNDGTAETDISNATIAVPFNTIRMSSTTASFNIIDDAIYEGSTPETITLTIEPSPTGFTRNASRDVVQVVSVGDNETAPTASFHTTYDPTAANENAGNPDFRLKLDKVSQLPTNVTVTAGASGSGVQATGYQDRNSGSNGGRYDYWLGAGANDTDGAITYTIPAFTTSGAAGPVMDITINDDAYFEDNESFRLTLSGADANASASATLDYTINQNNSDDQLPVISFETSSEESFTENGSSNLDKTIAVKLIDNNSDKNALVSGKDVTFSWSVTNADADGDGVSAIVNQDYALKDSDGNDVTSGTISAFTDPPVFNIPLRIIGDNTAEENKKITITLAIDGSVEGVDATVSGAISVTKTIEIVNDDADPEIQFSQATASVTEGSSTGSSDVVLQKVYSGSVDATEKTITLAVTKAGSGDRTATDNSNADGDDYDVATSISSISFGASDASKVITVNADNDDYYEESEEVTFTIGSVVNGTSPTSNDNIVLTINDADSAPVVSFDVANNETSKGEDATPTLQVVQDIKSQYTTATVNFAISAGSTYLTSEDYSTSVSSVELPPNSLSAVSIPITIVDDGLYEGAEIMTVAITAGSNCTVNSSLNSHNITIPENGTAPLLTFESASSSNNEGSGSDAAYNVIIKLLKHDGSGDDWFLGRVGSFSYTIAGTGSYPATEGASADFVLSSDPGTDKTVTLTPGSNGKTASSVTATITLKDDDVFEYNEELTLTLTASPTNLNISGNSTHVMTINEVEAAPKVGFAAVTAEDKNETDANTFTPRVILEPGKTSDYPVKIIWDIDEGETYSNTIVHAAESSGHPNTADYTMANSAGNAASRTVTIAAGQAYVDLPTMTLNGDSYYEDTEYLIIELASAKYYNGSDAEVGTNAWLSTASDNHNQKRVNITNTDGGKPTVTWNDVAQSSTEPDDGSTTVVQLQVDLDAVAGKDLKVKYSHLSSGYTSSNNYENNNAAETSDYSYSQADNAKIITIPAYSLSNTTLPTLTINSDTKYEMTEDIRIGLVQWSNSDDASSGDADGATVTSSNDDVLVYTINERDSAPILEFTDENFDDSGDYAASGAESNSSARPIKIRFKSGTTTADAEMDIHAYVTVDGASTAGNGVDFGSDASATAFASDFVVQIDAGETEQTFDFYAKEDNRYEEAQTAIFDINVYAAGESGKTTETASNATINSDGEKFTYTINASGVDELPIAEWVSPDGGGFPYTGISTSQVDEDDATIAITLQLNRYTEKDFTVTYTFDATNSTATLGSAAAVPVDFTHWTSGDIAKGTGHSASALATVGIVTSGTVDFNGADNSTSSQGSYPFATITIPVYDDPINEWAETIILTTDASTNSDLSGSDLSHTMKIMCNDTKPDVKFVGTSSSGDEPSVGGADVTLTVKLYEAGTTTETVSGKLLYVGVSTADCDYDGDCDQIATSGEDFDAIVHTDNTKWISFPVATSSNMTAGVYTSWPTIALGINHDLIDEEDQDVQVTLIRKGADLDGDKVFSSTDAGVDETDDYTLASPFKYLYTINDNDDAPVLMFDSETYSVEEAVGNYLDVKVKFVDNGSNIILTEKTITALISDKGTGDAVSVHDYNAITNETQLTVTDGVNGSAFNGITIVQDNRFENAETIVLDLTVNGASNASAGSAAQTTATITINADDDDVPQIQFYSSDGSAAANEEDVNETAGGFDVTFGISNNVITDRDIVIDYSIDLVNSTATVDDNETGFLASTNNSYPSDFRGWTGITASNWNADRTLKGQITMSADLARAVTPPQTASFTIPINAGDGVDENDDETILLSLDGVALGTLGAEQSFTIKIDDNTADVPVNVQFAASNPTTGAENATDPAFVIELVDASGNQKESGKEIVVDWANRLGTAEAIDINSFAEDGSVTFTPRTGSGTAAPVTQTVTIDVVDNDATYETDETFTISVLNTTNSSEVGTQENTYTITNIDPAPKVEFVSSTYTLSEAAGDNGPTIDVGYRISTGDASNYAELTEEDITVYFKVSSSDDNFANGTDIANLADYTSGTITATSTDNTITLTAVGDGLDEANESFNLNMYTYNADQTSSNANVSTQSYAVTPQNSESGSQGYDQTVITLVSDPNDKPDVSFYNVATSSATSAISVPESDGTVTVSLKLSSISQKTVTVPYTLTLDYDNDNKTARIGSASDNDYPYDYRAWDGLTVVGDVSGNSVTATGTIDIPAGQDRADITITINNDGNYEFDETINLSIGSPTNASKASDNTELVITISNDGEDKTTVAFSSASNSGNEDDVSPINIPISLAKESGKDVVLKYSIDYAFNYPKNPSLYYDSDNPNNKNIATKGIDYTFGNTVEKNAAGDSIITIEAGQTTVNIPLTIVDDDIDEYNQLLRVSISVINTIADNDAALVGDDSVFTYNIIDEDPEPYILFEPDASVSESNSGTLTKNITVSLINESSELIDSEKIITASYNLDVNADSTSASFDSDVNVNVYEDDFHFTNGSLSFNGRTYSYSSADDEFTPTSGETSKTIDLLIYGDVLYEVNETVTIDLTPADFVIGTEKTSGDHSFVYTIKDDDGLPTVSWDGSNLLREGDTLDANTDGFYDNNDLKVTLSKPSGTDILVEYSLKSETGTGIATEGNSETNDFFLGNDNTDLSGMDPAVNTKSVIIPAATDANSDLFISVPIKIWNDEIVEGSENFTLQIDRYRTKGIDKDWATSDDSLTSVNSSDYEFQVTIDDNDNPPDAFTVADVITQTSSSDEVVTNHWNPITPGYWNSYNSGLLVTVPIASDADLKGGNVFLIVSKDPEEIVWDTLATDARVITQADQSAGTYTFDVSRADFEGVDAYGEGEELFISAILTDDKGNSTRGTKSTTTIKIDKTAPVIANYSIDSVASTGGTFNHKYWNSTNTGFDVIVKVAGVDASVTDGSVIVLAGVGANADDAVYRQIGDPVQVESGNNNSIGDSLKISITEAQFEDQSGYDQGRIVNVRAQVVDAAGNKVFTNIASTKTVIDTVSPKIMSVQSVDIDGNAKNGDFGIDSLIRLKFTFSEILKLTADVAQIEFDDGMISKPEINSADLQWKNTITVPFNVQANESSSLLEFKGLTFANNSSLQDSAGNDMIVFTAEDGSSLEDLSEVIVDGVAPSPFSIDSLFVQGSNSVYGYWNSNSTSIIVPILASTQDVSLEGGKVQIQGIVYGDSPLDTVDIGVATVLVEDAAIGGGLEPPGEWNNNIQKHYGQISVADVHFEIDRSSIEAALSSLDNYPDKNAADPEQTVKVGFRVKLSDKAGNTTASDTISLKIDEVMPLDPEFGLPTEGYTYRIDTAIDNYIDVIPDTAALNSVSRSGFFNSTNTGIIFKSWIAFDDPNNVITIDRDNSLIDGFVQVQMASSSDVATATWTDIGTPDTIKQSDIDAGFITVTVAKESITASSAYSEGATVYFRNKVSDKAGNITEQSTVSSKNITIDTTPLAFANLEYSRKYVNGTDHSPTIRVKFDTDPINFPYDAPKLTATINIAEPSQFITSQSMTIDTTGGVLDSSSYSFKLDVPGERGSDLFDATVTISLEATDKAGNLILQDVITDKEYLVVDNTPPTVEFQYANTINALNPINSGKYGDRVEVTAVLSEGMWESPDDANPLAEPSLSVDPLSVEITTNIDSDNIGVYDAADADFGDSTTVKFEVALPIKSEAPDFENQDLNLEFRINGTDWAGNPVDTLTGYISNSNLVFKFDNKAPSFSNFNISDNAFIDTTALDWSNDNDALMSSASIRFKPVGDFATPPVANEGNPIALKDSSIALFNELSRDFNPPISPYYISNNSSLVDALADSNTYDVIFKGTDLVGNVDSITINSVTYDTKHPTVEVAYETKYITALGEKAGTQINLTFNEVQRVEPTIKLYYGGILSQNAEGASWDAANLSTTFIDTSNLNKIEGPIALTNSGDGRTWYHVIDADSVVLPVPSGAFDGYVWVRVFSQDLAGNYLQNNDPTSLEFDGLDDTDDNFLYLDNTQPTATLTYTNLRDSSLTIFNADNESESYCCFAIAGDSVLIKVEMNEAIVYDASDNSKIPKLDLKYNYIDQDTETNGSTQLDEIPFLISEETLFAGINFKDSIDSDAKTANIFHYKIGIKDGVNNSGTLKLTLNAKDISGTPVTVYGLSPQKSGTDSSQYALEIDNFHPWGIPGDSIFVEAIDSVTFPTEQFTTTGYRVVENWINRETTHIYVGVPYQNPGADNSLMNNNPDWGPQGKIDVQLKNLFGTNEWQTIGTADTISPGTPQTVAIGEDYFLRTVSRPVSDFANSASMINQDTTSSNKLQFRGVITDKNGNVTYGQPSDAYSVNSDGLYVSDLLNIDEVGYDIVAPNLGAINDGNFDTEYVFGDTLRIISTDTITISWSEFIDPGDAAASGVDLYEMQVYTYPSWNVTEVGPGQYSADTLGMTDSLFTVDMNLDGIDDPGHWYKIYKEQAPTFNNPITLNTLDSVVTDSLSDASIIYDYNDTLKHELYYMIAVRAFDTAGNASDTIYTNAIQRYNSAPAFIDNLANLTLYEDIAWDYDTVKVSDLDLSTLQSDSFTYTIFPEKIVPNLAGGFDTNAVLINPPVVDESTGLVSWTPIQDSTLTLEGADTIIDQSGNYLFTFKVEDAYGFKDSINFNATVNAVNDTPVVAILGDDKVLTWQEDKPATEIVKINLSNYVKDIDNLDSEISWQFVIMDTSQLDEDFPLASVIVGPGTPKAVQTKLMRKYMGFDPSKGIDIPTLAKKSGNETMRMLTNADSYISIDIDTSIPDSTIAIFSSDSNYHGSNHRIIFSAIDPFGALDKDTIIVNILPENDPPVVAAIDTIIINENDSIWVDFSQFTSDVDDTTLTFKIEGVYNTDSINYVSEPYLSDGLGDTVLFDPFDLWSGYANFRVIASDEEAESSQLFTLKVLRVPRPDIQVSLVQNNAFSSYVSIIIVDKEQKTKFLQLEVQNQRIDIDTVAAYTYTGDFSFGIGGGYSFDVLAVAEVGKTIYTNTFNLAPARVSNRWYANSSDGRFSVAGDPGSVDTDQSFLIVDSSLFISNFSDQASYVLGEETYMFTKPIEVHFGSMRKDLSIYQRENGVIWKELPSVNRNGQILTFTENAGYFRLGPKTIIVPEETDLHQNYPNPFNPSTTIKYDIGLMDGINQRVSVNVYNLTGQHVTTLINNESQVGQFYVRWDGSNKFGKMLPSGIYFVQLKTDSGIIKNKKMMFLK